jgi:hypothetical protein
MLKVIATVLACLLVSACGGYLQDETAAAPTECPVVGQTLDTNGARLEGVAVSVQLDGARHEAVSDAAGRWRIVMPVAYPYPRQFAGTAKKEGYSPSPVVFKTTGACPAAADGSVRLRALTVADVVFPLGEGVTHLGDDVFTGDVNSQLQLPSSGLQWSDAFTYTDSMRAQFTSLCVTMLARGVQSARQNVIQVAREDGTPVERLLMNDTDAAGGYTDASHCFSLAPFRAGDRVVVTIESGNGGLSVLDYDDFEFLSVVGSLN